MKAKRVVRLFTIALALTLLAVGCQEPAPTTPLVLSTVGNPTSDKVVIKISGPANQACKVLFDGNKCGDLENSHHRDIPVNVSAHAKPFEVQIGANKTINIAEYAGKTICLQAVTDDQASNCLEIQVPTPLPPATKKSAIVTFFETLEALYILNPYYSSYQSLIQLFKELQLAALWSYDEQMNKIPELAAEIPTTENGGISTDGLTITIFLRDDAAWSDGTPLTAHDFVFTYEMLIDERNAIQNRYPYDSRVESFGAPDDYTIEIVTNEPLAAWATCLNMSPLPKHVLEPIFEAEGTIDNADWNRNPTVGVGPFVFRDRTDKDRIVLAANPNYWRGTPRLDEIHVRSVPDEGVLTVIAHAGETDIGAYVAARHSPDIDALEGWEMMTIPTGNVESWFFNLDPETGHPALQEKEVRQAIVMGMDRQWIIDELFYGLCEVPATFWHDTPYEDPYLEPWPYDPGAAAELLDWMGWIDTNGDGFRDRDGMELILRYSTTAGNQMREATQATVSDMLAEIGVGIEIQNYPPALFWARYSEGGPIATGRYDIAQWSQRPWHFPDPDTYSWLCSEIPSNDYPDGLNWFGVCFPDLDDLFYEQAPTLDMGERAEIYYEIEAFMHEEMFWAGLRTDPGLWAVNTARLRNSHLSSVTPFWNAYEWDVSE